MRTARRLRDWRHSTSVVDTQDEGFTDLVARSAQDLGALRIVDPHDASQVAVAAGAPWFMTIFGRDSLLTSWMALPLDPSLAVGTLRTLARGWAASLAAPPGTPGFGPGAPGIR